MNAELIERIDDCIYNRSGQSLIKSCKVIIDCKVEIERLESELQKAREYVRLNNAEWQRLHKSRESIRDWADSPSGKASGIDFREAGVYGFSRMLESEVIKRANLIVKEKE